MAAKFETAHESLGTEIGALRRLTLFGFNTQYQTRRKSLAYLLLIKPYFVPYFVTAHSKSYGSSISVSSFSVYPSSDTYSSEDFSLSQSSSSASTEIRISSSSSERPFSLYPSSSRSGLSFSPTSERSGLSTSPTSGKSSYNSRSYIL